MKEINPRERLTPEEHLFLFWFENSTREVKIEYENFQPTESLIKRYNAYIKKWSETFSNDRVHYEKSVDWDIDRQKTEYFKGKLQAGHEFEVWVEQEFEKESIDLGSFFDEQGQYAGENNFGIEIKHDMKLAETGNIYIEYQERLKNSMNWVNSGVLKDDNTIYWIIGSPKEYYIFSKADLKKLYESIIVPNARINGCKLVAEKENQTSKGFIMSRQKAKEICIAESISDFVRKLNAKIYARVGYYHGDRNCSYIRSKNDSELKFFNSVEEAEKNNYKPCTNENCIAMIKN